MCAEGVLCREDGGSGNDIERTSCSVCSGWENGFALEDRTFYALRCSMILNLPEVVGSLECGCTWYPVAI